MRAEAGLAASFSAGYDDDHNDFDDHIDDDDELKRGGPTWEWADDIIFRYIVNFR